MNYFIFYYIINKYKIIRGMGIGDWQLAIGDLAQSPISNPQSPIPNPQLKNKIYIKIKNIKRFLKNKEIINIFLK